MLTDVIEETRHQPDSFGVMELIITPPYRAFLAAFHFLPIILHSDQHLRPIDIAPAKHSPCRQLWPHANNIRRYTT